MPIDLIELKNFNPYDVYLNQISGDRFKYNQFNDKLKKLPENLQDFIFDTIPADFIKDRIAIPLGLNENQSKEIAIIVMDLILANLYLGNIVSEIQNKVIVDEQKAQTIAGLIVTELFAPILEELKKMHIEKFAREQIAQPQTQSNQNFDDRVVDLKNQL